MIVPLSIQSLTRVSLPSNKQYVPMNGTTLGWLVYRHITTSSM
jgi:hypothetical protein